VHMALHRILASVALTAALAFPATASAAQRGVEGHSKATAATRLAAAFAVGQRFWGAVPCNGDVKLLARQAPPSGDTRANDAWVTFDSSLGANNLAAPASSYTNCTIAFAADGPWPTARSMRSDWNMFCTTMTHELGHLLGHAHDLTPGSVMLPVFNDRSSVTSSCRSSRPARKHR
jgi:hypothetical protein